MKPQFMAVLSKPLRELSSEIESYCGFEIEVRHNPQLADRGALIHSPSSIVIEVAALPAMPSVLAHELCHAKRYFLEQVPFFELIPPRFFGRGGQKVSAAEHLDNMLEHIFILREMKNRFGFPKDASHIANDFEWCSRDIPNELYRKSIILTNWLLANFHFPEYVPGFRNLLEREGMLDKGQCLLTHVEAAGDCKPRVVAALMEALDIDKGEVRLRTRSVKSNCDLGTMLGDCLEELSRVKEEKRNELRDGFKDDPGDTCTS